MSSEWKTVQQLKSCTKVLLVEYHLEDGLGVGGVISTSLKQLRIKSPLFRINIDGHKCFKKSRAATLPATLMKKKK